MARDSFGPRLATYFFRRLTADADMLDSYRVELAESKLLDRLDEAKQAFQEKVSGTTYRGFPYGFGGMRPESSCRLYSLIRWLRPSVLVETGVCNGVSTAVLLAALKRNGGGMLYSIDLPEFTDTAYADKPFWKGKRGAAVPRGKAPGWVIPEELRAPWKLILGRSQDKLTPLLEYLGAIDFFLHDSEHSYACMTFEYQAAWRHLRVGGVLGSDDIGWNTAFKDFSRQHSREIYPLSENLAFLVK